MRRVTEAENKHRQDRAVELRNHRWRVENWATVKEFWIPKGLTCPGCHGDHCEIDGHYCWVTMPDPHFAEEHPNG